MIGTVAYQFLRSAWGRYVIIGLAFFAALTAWGRAKKRAGRAEYRLDQIKDIRSRSKEGRDAYHQSRRETTGSSIDALSERVRRNDDHWRGMPDLW